NGDERDKDVANAIRYAVDNGATVINMSFGKAYSWDKKIVDDAVRYAQKNDVILVHAAGNDGKNNDNTDNFPNDAYAKKGWFKPKKAKTWIEVGALNHDTGENAAASFSNYGKDQVDVFAPGVAIYSTTADNEYDSYPGTSMASPMVAGVAALLRSYYPELSANQVKDIIMDSSVKSTQKVVKPGTEDEKVNFSDLSVTGGMLNSFNAIQKAEKTKGKRKKKFRGKAAKNAKAIEKMNKA
ncbi:MAG: cell wall-associated protease, partial [Saprospiraceae bacterium]